MVVGEKRISTSEKNSHSIRGYAIDETFYEGEYNRIETNARREAFNKSFISMFRNYLAFSLADKNFLKEVFEKFNSDVLSGDAISKELSNKIKNSKNIFSKKQNQNNLLDLNFEEAPSKVNNKSFLEIKKLIDEAYKRKNFSSVKIATRAIRDNFFNGDIKSNQNWDYLVNALEKLSKINSSSVREGLKYSFQKDSNSFERYKSKLIFELKEEGKQIMDDLQLFANKLKSKGKNKIGVVNATFNGGGPAEMFGTIGPILAELGIEVEWHIIYPTSPLFYEISKGIHNTLQGNDVFWDKRKPQEEVQKEMESKLNFFDSINKLNSKILKDFFNDETVASIFIEDPQVIPLVKYGSNIKAWRLHTDISGIIKKNPGAIMIWERFKEYLNNLGEDNLVMFQPGLVPPVENLKAKVVEQYPGIDPLSEKNRHMKDEEFFNHISQINRNKKQIFGQPLNIDAPTIVTGSRFDYWKGLPIVLKAFEKKSNLNKSIRLVIFGSYADDDPEGKQHYSLVKKIIQNSPVRDRITLLRGYSGRKIGSLYKLASRNKMPFIAYSLKEGYNLMTNENEIQGGASIVARTGGLKRYKTGFNSLAALEVDKITKNIQDASKLYRFEKGRLVISKQAKILEEMLCNVFENIFVKYQLKEYASPQIKNNCPKQKSKIKSTVSA